MGWIGAASDFRGTGGGGEGLLERVLEGEGAFGNGTLIAVEVAQGSGGLEVDVHPAFVNGSREGVFHEPVLNGSTEVVLALRDSVLEVVSGEGFELGGPEFEVEVAGAEVAEIGVGGEGAVPAGPDHSAAGRRSSR